MTIDDPGTPASTGLVDALTELSTPADTAPEVDFMSAFNADVPAIEEPKKEEAAPAKEEKAPETPAADADDIDKIEEPTLTKSSRPQWDELKGQAKNYKAKALAAEEAIAAKDAEVQAALTKAQEAESRLAEIEEIKEKAAKWEEAEKELAVSRVEGSEQFKNVVLKPLKAIFDRAAEMAKANEIAESDLTAAIREGDPAKQRALLKEILPSLDEVDRIKFARMVEDAADIYNKEDEIRENALTAKKELEERQSKEGVKAKETAKKEFTAAVDHSMGELRKRIPFVELEKGETPDAVFNALLDKARGTDFDAATPGTKAYAALAGVSLVRVTKQLQAVLKENETLKARVAEGSSAEPTVGKTEATVKAQEKDFLDDIGGFLGVSKSTSHFVGTP